MKKALVLLFSAIFLIILASVAGLYWLMQSQHASKVANYLLQNYSETPITVEQAKYSYPNKITLNNLEIQQNQQQPLSVTQLDIWLDIPSLLSDKIIINSLLINGLSLQQGLPDIQLSERLNIAQIALTNLDYSDKQFIARDINIQINQPEFTQQNILPFGTIQFSATQVYWQGEAFNDLLVDADFKASESTIYGASFNWRGGKISGQAEQYEDGWSLVNVTIDQLRLNKQKWREISDLDWQGILGHISSVNSLDMLDSTIELPQWQLVNANLSVENITLPFDQWQQSNGYVSVSAESIGFDEQLLLEPVFELYFDPQKITLEEGTTEFQKGLFQASGEYQPDSLKLSRLYISGLRWINEDQSLLTELKSRFAKLDTLSIQDLKIQHSQFIQLAQEPNWQVSGLNVEGSKLSLRKEGKAALWNGKLGITANNASYDDLYSSHPVINMNSRNGLWELSDVFIPLEEGLIEANGVYQLDKISRPWHLEASAYGLPSSLFAPWLDLPFQFEANSDFQLQASGLAADMLSFNHSLTGSLKGSLRDAVLITTRSESDIVAQPVEVSDFKLTADRGRISFPPIRLNGNGMKGTLSGQYDLLSQDKNKLLLQLKEKCKSDSFNLLNNKVESSNNCQ